MYVPPDEAPAQGGEVHMHLSAEGISAVDTSGMAAINPVYEPWVQIYLDCNTLWLLYFFFIINS